MRQQLKLRLDGKAFEVPKGTRFLELVKQFSSGHTSPILLMTLDGTSHELGATVEEEEELRFLTIRDEAGYQSYERSAILFLLAAYHKLYGERSAAVWIDYKESGVLCYHIAGRQTVTETEFARLEAEMRVLAMAVHPTEKRSVPTREAVRLFVARGVRDKAELLRFRIYSSINLYRLGEYEDRFYGYMLPDSSYPIDSSLQPYKNGFILCLPAQRLPVQLAAFQLSQKTSRAMEESRENLSQQKIETVGAPNARATSGKMRELVLCTEAQVEKRIGDLVEGTCGRNAVRIALIVGPSSSGKTTFARRPAIQLLALGRTPHVIEVDNYFKNRGDTLHDEKGSFDFESLGAPDVDCFNCDLNALLRGERVELPRFDFISGERCYSGDFSQCMPSDVLLVEGIHCLNEALSFSIPAEKKHKIYVSCLTQLNLDAHNCTPTSDVRILRHIVQDARLRGNNAAENLVRWVSVSAGETRYISPYQEDVGDVFNSALLCETAALKPYAEALLFDVPEEYPSLLEAKRLPKFLSYSLTFPSEEIPATFLLRELTGGSTYGT